MRLLPPATIPSRAVTISVDLPDTSRLVSTRNDDVARRLLPVFQRYGLPVTWGLTMSNRQLMSDVLSSHPEHQVALLGDTQAIGDTTQRNSFRRQLERAIAGFTSAGQQVSTLVVRRAHQIQHLELLIKHGISLVASDEQISTNQPTVTTLRYGLWAMPAIVSVPSGRGLAGGSRRLIDGTVSRDKLVHVAIDGPATAATAKATRALERLLHHIARRRSQGYLQIVQLGEIVAQLPCCRTTPIARSALRIATDISRAA